MVFERTQTSAPLPEPPLSRLGLDTLSARFRPGGVCVAVIGPDGRVVYVDRSAGTFFQLHALPSLDRAALAAAPAGQLSTVEPAEGVIVALVPWVDRRQSCWSLALVARSAVQLGDAHHAAIDAERLPIYTPAALQHQARLMLAVAGDLLRVGGLEQEVETLSSQLANSYEELSLIYQLSGGMKISRGAADFFRQACLDVAAVMGVRGMGVALRAESLENTDPVLYGSVTLPPGEVNRLSTQLIDQLRADKKTLLVNDISRIPAYAWLAGSAQRMLAVPLQRQDEVLGCLFALDKSNGDFDTVDAKLLNSIANESAIYLENAMLFEDVRGLLMGLLHSLTSAVDAKDTYTCGHSERVAMLSRTLAVEAGLDEAAVERIYMAGLLHDVGKIGVPEAVLQKPGKLTAEEFEQMKEHPEIGARILRDVKQLDDVVPGVLHHHEKFDGTGYPSGLAGDAIPIMGRIIGLADCFDAMTSTRTYRQALPFEVALLEIRRGAGTQFDPVLADAFLRIGEPRLRELLSNHQPQNLSIIEPRPSRLSA